MLYSTMDVSIYNTLTTSCCMINKRFWYLLSIYFQWIRSRWVLFADLNTPYLREQNVINYLLYKNKVSFWWQFSITIFLLYYLLCCFVITTNYIIGFMISTTIISISLWKFILITKIRKITWQVFVIVIIRFLLRYNS